MKRKLLRLVGSIGLAFIVLVLGVFPVLAIANPISTVINFSHVFENIFVDGDQIFYVRYDVDYAAPPTEFASDTFLMALYDTDGTTLLFQRPLNYYEHDLISIYLTPAQALTWGSAYVIKITGNPSIFPILTEGINLATRTLGALDYTAGAATVSRATLGASVLTSAQYIEADTGDVWIGALTDRLTALGAIHVNAAIPGLASVAPEIYETGVSTPELEPSSRSVYIVGTPSGAFTVNETVIGGTSGVTGTYRAVSSDGIQTTVDGINMFTVGETVTGSTSGRTIVVGSLVIGQIEKEAIPRAGPRLRNALDNFGAWLGMSGNAFGGLALFMVFITAAGFIFVRTGQVHGAIVIAIPLLLLGNFMGLLSFAVTWLVVIVVALVFGIFFIMGRF